MDDHLMAMDRIGGTEAIATLPPEPEAEFGGLAVVPPVAAVVLTAPLPVNETPRGPRMVRDDEADDSPEVELAQVIEALLFASDVPLTPGRLAELAGAGTPTAVRKAVAELNERYASAQLSFRIEAIAGGFQMLTLPLYRTWLVKLNKQRAKTRLSAAALETLSIIAYKQPIIRAEVDAIRGVSGGDAISRLRDLGLIKIVGRAEMIGRPMLYGTTRKFLDMFGLASLDDLPPLENLNLAPAPDAESDTDSSQHRQAAGA